MATRTDAKTLWGCIGVIIGLPVLGLWLYLVYQILVRVDATSAMWAAYWTYVPLTILVSIVSAIGKMIDGSWRDD